MPARGVSRRAVIAGAAALLAAPVVRPARAAPDAPDAILARSGLAALSGFAIADVATGELVEAHQPQVERPPASVAKVITSLYALEALGPDYRFRTRIRGTGPVVDGVLQGTLTLEGGGDPLLDTDALGDLARALQVAGLRGAEGFAVDVAALPAIERIVPDQPEDAGYDPSIAGLNLNFNRVELTWAPGKAGPMLGFGAPGQRFGATVASVRGKVAEGGQARHRMQGAHEVWTLPRRSLAGSGSVWLPVRAVGPYAGEVFRSLAVGAGLALPEAVVAPGAGGVLALHDSPGLAAVLRGMLRYSTNLTAEVVGLRSGQARGVAPADLAESAAAMTVWARTRYGLRGAAFVNHSGLSDSTHVSPEELVQVLVQAEAQGLPGLLRERPILDSHRKPIEIGGVQVQSKTGTLNFVSALAGYISGPRRYAFAILAADPALRAKVRPDQRDDPPGGAAWLSRARAQEQALLRRWALAYG
jgi:serine-type D-Ala-D-Ala carboxypeptidase/endopeptidase (penicillin-binding protein 4)